MNKKDLVLSALADYGTTEIVGGKHNIKILKYFEDAGHSWVQNDEMAWCAAFLNAVLARAGFPHTGKLNARSFLELGIETTEPEIGDIVVLWRVAQDSPYGHCGLFIARDESWIYMLGGNQANAVNITKFPVYMLLGYRKLEIEA